MRTYFFPFNNEFFYWIKGKIPVLSSENSGTNLRTANRKPQIDRPYGPWSFISSTLLHGLFCWIIKLSPWQSILWSGGSFMGSTWASFLPVVTGTWRQRHASCFLWYQYSSKTAIPLQDWNGSSYSCSSSLVMQLILEDFERHVIVRLIIVDKKRFSEERPNWDATSIYFNSKNNGRKLVRLIRPQEVNPKKLQQLLLHSYECYQIMLL